MQQVIGDLYAAAQREPAGPTLGAIVNAIQYLQSGFSRTDWEDVAQPVQPCRGCNGHGEVGGLRSDGYHSEMCPYCKGDGTEQIAQPVHPKETK